MPKTEEQEHAIIAIVDNRFIHNSEPKTEVLGVVKFETTPAIVRRGYGLTLNLGNYESARIDVSIELPCYVEDIDRADEFACNWVGERIIAERESIRGTDKKSEEAPEF